MLGFVCIAEGTRSGIADELDACGRSCRSMRQTVECGREEMRVRRALLLSAEKDAEVRTR